MKIWELVMRLCGGISAALIAAMTLLVSYDVIARNLGLGSLPWVLEVTEYMLPALICASAPWLMFRGSHIRLDLLRTLLPRRMIAPLDKATAAVAALSSAVFTFYALKLMLASKASGNLVIKALVFPEWWVYLPVPIGFGLLTLECLRQMFRPAETHADLVS